tara:strand:- start:322 stop:711 length:390 start_codon:yes stop_codon:yes gene_type:complete
MEFNKATLNVIRQKMQEAMNLVPLHQGDTPLSQLKFVVGRCSYGAQDATFKVTVSLEGSESKEERDLVQMAGIHQLDVNKVGTINGNLKCTLSGYRHRARKNPYIVTSVDDETKQYVITTARAKEVFAS